MRQISAMSSRWLPGYAAPVVRTRAYADIWSGIGGTRLENGIPLVSGTITIDRGNSIRRTASSVTFVPDAAGLLLPTTLGGGLLYPSGVEIALYKGLEYEDGSTEYASLGWFLLGDTQVKSDDTGVTIPTTLSDRGLTIGNSAFLAPYATDGISTVDVAIINMIQQQVPELTDAYFNFQSSDIVPAVQTYTAGTNPWTSAQSLAAAIGYELFPDEQGKIVLQPIPDPTTIAPCASYIEGTPAAPTSFMRELNLQNAPNVVIVTAQGSNVDTPTTMYWWDSNPNSRTFFASGSPPATELPAREGSYPPIVATLNTSVVPTPDDVAAIALAAGAVFIGQFESVQINIRDNPAHDVDDVVALQRAVAGAATPTNYVFDQVVVDISPANAQQMTGRLVAA